MERAIQAANAISAVALFREASPAAVEAKRTAKFTWLAAGMDGAFKAFQAAGPLPAEYVVVATDGSHIDVDRNAPARSSLVNIGKVMLRYGELADASLTSTPALFTEESDLVLRDPESGLRAVPLEGPLLGMKRAVMELEALAELVESIPPDLPVLALLDGSLVLFGLAGQGYPDFVRKALLDEGLLRALDRLRAQAERRTLAVASYISLPGSREVVNALRLHVCPYGPVDCDRHCRHLSPGDRACDAVQGVTDRELFASVMTSGERTSCFRSLSSVVTEHYGSHAVRFFYLHAGHEIARVEMLTWSAEVPAVLEFAHAALLAQVEKGHGYPVALSEAHEQAVVTGPDRMHFEVMVEDTLSGEHLPLGTSEKARSKRTRFV
jgi:hypothetical protein